METLDRLDCVARITDWGIEVCIVTDFQNIESQNMNPA